MTIVVFNWVWCLAFFALFTCVGIAKGIKNKCSRHRCQGCPVYFCPSNRIFNLMSGCAAFVFLPAAILAFIFNLSFSIHFTTPAEKHAQLIELYDSVVKQQISE